MVIPTWLIGAMLLAASAGGFLGYRVGAYRLDEVTETLAETRRELDTQAGQFQQAKQRLTDSADAIAAAHQLDLTKLQERSAQDEERLKSANAEATQRVTVLDARLAAMDRERSALRQTPSTPADAASAALRLAALDAQRSTIVNERDGLDCLAAAVPEPQLAALRGR
jgi:chromosome segregation ATPase